MGNIDKLMNSSQVFSCGVMVSNDAHGAGFVRLRENLEKGTFWKKSGKPGKLRELPNHFYNLREHSGNSVSPNISDQIGCALRINE